MTYPSPSSNRLLMTKMARSGSTPMGNLKRKSRNRHTTMKRLMRSFNRKKERSDKEKPTIEKLIHILFIFSNQSKINELKDRKLLSYALNKH